MSREIACPSCGAPQDISNPGVAMSVCEYCGNAVVLSDEGVENIGKQAILSEGFTRLFRGATGSLHGNRFRVLGRARYSFGQGFWDEWFIDRDGAGPAWVTEDNHELALQRAVTSESLPTTSSLRPGVEVTVHGTTYVVHEVGEARCIGVEGELPRTIKTNDAFAYADASSRDGRYVLGIEQRDPPQVFTGRWVSHSSLVLDDPGYQA